MVSHPTVCSLGVTSYRVCSLGVTSYSLQSWCHILQSAVLVSHPTVCSLGVTSYRVCSLGVTSYSLQSWCHILQFHSPSTSDYLPDLELVDKTPSETVAGPDGMSPGMQDKCRRTTAGCALCLSTSWTPGVAGVSAGAEVQVGRWAGGQVYVKAQVENGKCL